MSSADSDETEKSTARVALPPPAGAVGRPASSSVADRATGVKVGGASEVDDGPAPGAETGVEGAVVVEAHHHRIASRRGDERACGDDRLLVALAVGRPAEGDGAEATPRPEVDHDYTTGAERRHEHAVLGQPGHEAAGSGRP